MVICGLKLTHDGALAVVENNKLLFAIELEKIKNNLRYTAMEDTAMIADILKDEGLKPSDVDRFVVDGWGGNDMNALAIQPRLKIQESVNILSADDGDASYEMNIAQYTERSAKHNVVERRAFNGLKIKGEQFAYSSYLHVAGHVMSAYSTSPFAKRGEDSYVLVWDGGMFPRLYYYNCRDRKIDNLGPLFLYVGNIYTIFSQHFGPFKVGNGFAKDSLSVAGKVMAYVAFGQLREELFPVFDAIYQELYDKPMGFANVFANAFKERMASHDYTDEDILLTFHVYLGNMLVEKLNKKVERCDDGTRANNLCYAGGCALNIKWNSDIRNSGTFKEVYVPPFPNDSGSAIGMACCEMFHLNSVPALNWNVYSGPRLAANDSMDNWEQRPCSLKELAQVLYQTKEPLVFLNDRSELGPRALGNRSILADPGSPKMKHMLNVIKDREDYRPVSPICLESQARKFFVPGTPDPFMLFDHRVKKEWLDRIPAICHVDETARLQTVTHDQNSVMAELLTEFEALSGLPMLCNTSANLKGSGFFPDVESVMQWNRVNYVWSDFKLYSRRNSASVGEKSRTKQEVANALSL
jgi:carbamoyltransferase